MAPCWFRVDRAIYKVKQLGTITCIPVSANAERPSSCTRASVGCAACKLRITAIVDHGRDNRECDGRRSVWNLDVGRQGKQGSGRGQRRLRRLPRLLSLSQRLLQPEHWSQSPKVE